MKRSDSDKDITGKMKVNKDKNASKYYNCLPVIRFELMFSNKKAHCKYQNKRDQLQGMFFLVI